jgi:hypothetical protein
VDSHVTRARWSTRRLAGALALTGLGLLTALGASSASESSDIEFEKRRGTKRRPSPISLFDIDPEELP